MNDHIKNRKDKMITQGLFQVKNHSFNEACAAKNGGPHHLGTPPADKNDASIDQYQNRGQRKGSQQKPLKDSSSQKTIKSKSKRPQLNKNRQTVAAYTQAKYYQANAQNQNRQIQKQKHYHDQRFKNEHKKCPTDDDEGNADLDAEEDWMVNEGSQQPYGVSNQIRPYKALSRSPRNPNARNLSQNQEDIIVNFVQQEAVFHHPKQPEQPLEDFTSIPNDLDLENEYDEEFDPQNHQDEDDATHALEDSVSSEFANGEIKNHEKYANLGSKVPKDSDDSYRESYALQHKNVSTPQLLENKKMNRRAQKNKKSQNSKQSLQASTTIENQSQNKINKSSQNQANLYFNQRQPDIAQYQQSRSTFSGNDQFLVKTPELKTIQKNVVRATVGGPRESSKSSAYRNRTMEKPNLSQYQQQRTLMKSQKINNHKQHEKQVSQENNESNSGKHGRQSRVKSLYATTNTNDMISDLQKINEGLLNAYDDQLSENDQDIVQITGPQILENRIQSISARKVNSQHYNQMKQMADYNKDNTIKDSRFNQERCLSKIQTNQSSIKVINPAQNNIMNNSSSLSKINDSNKQRANNLAGQRTSMATTDQIAQRMPLEIQNKFMQKSQLSLNMAQQKGSAKKAPKLSELLGKSNSKKSFNQLNMSKRAGHVSIDVSPNARSGINSPDSSSADSKENERAKSQTTLIERLPSAVTSSQGKGAAAQGQPKGIAQNSTTSIKNLHFYTNDSDQKIQDIKHSTTKLTMAAWLRKYKQDLGPGASTQQSRTNQHKTDQIENDTRIQSIPQCYSPKGIKLTQAGRQPQNPSLVPPMKLMPSTNKFATGTFHPRTAKNQTSGSSSGGAGAIGAKGDILSVKSSHRNFNSIYNQEDKKYGDGGASSPTPSSHLNQQSNRQFKGKRIPQTTVSARGGGGMSGSIEKNHIGAATNNYVQIPSGKQGINSQKKQPQHFNFMNVSELMIDEDDDIDENEENIENRQLGQINPQISETKYSFKRKQIHTKDHRFAKNNENLNKQKNLDLRLSCMEKISEKVEEGQDINQLEGINNEPPLWNEGLLIINKPRQQQTNHSFNEKMHGKKDYPVRQLQGLASSEAPQNPQSNLSSFLNFIPGMSQKESLRKQAQKDLMGKAGNKNQQYKHQHQSVEIVSKGDSVTDEHHNGPNIRIQRLVTDHDNELEEGQQERVQLRKVTRGIGERERTKTALMEGTSLIHEGTQNSIPKHFQAKEILERQRQLAEDGDRPQEIHKIQMASHNQDGRGALGQSQVAETFEPRFHERKQCEREPNTNLDIEQQETIHDNDAVFQKAQILDQDGVATSPQSLLKRRQNIGPVGSKIMLSEAVKKKQSHKSSQRLQVGGDIDDPTQELEREILEKLPNNGCNCNITQEREDSGELHQKKGCINALNWLKLAYKGQSFKHYNGRSGADEQLIQIEQDIEQDLERTFQHIAYFRRADIHQSLKRILIAFSNYETSVGYVQGMNFIAAVLLFHAGEVAAFWLLCALMEKKYQLKYVLSMGLPGLQAHEECIEALGRQRLPELFAHFDSHFVSLNLFSTDWIISVFLNFIPIELTHLYLNKFFEKSWQVFYDVAIAILKFYEKDLLQMNDLAQIVGQIKQARLGCEHLLMLSSSPHQSMQTSKKNKSFKDLGGGRASTPIELEKVSERSDKQDQNQRKSNLSGIPFSVISLVKHDEFSRDRQRDSAVLEDSRTSMQQESLRHRSHTMMPQNIKEQNDRKHQRQRPQIDDNDSQIISQLSSSYQQNPLFVKNLKMWTQIIAEI